MLENKANRGNLDLHLENHKNLPNSPRTIDTVKITINIQYFFSNLFNIKFFFLPKSKLAFQFKVERV